MLPHSRLIEAPGTRPVQVIAVTGGKGGIGKTSVSINLATALARSGQRVLLLDGDLGLANIDVLLGLTPRFTLEHVLSGERELAEVLLQSRDGVRVVPAASGVARMAQLDGPQHAALVRAFSTLPENFDVMIVDTAAGIGESVCRFSEAAQHVLVVIRDEPTSLTDAYALIKVLSREHAVRRFHVLVNMVRDGGSGQLLVRRLQRVTDRYLDVQLTWAGDIPDDPYVGRAIRAQRASLEAYPGSRSSRAFVQLAAQLRRWPREQGPSGRLEFFFERLLATPPTRLKVIK
jgi:flagellar biosynthesis protein FlhG